MSWKLYIDDTRSPEGDDWTIARSYKEAIKFCDDKGKPSEVSFDHDLGEDVPSGLEIAREMLRHDWMPDKTNVHSANPIGAERIREVIEDGEVVDWESEFKE